MQDDNLFIKIVADAGSMVINSIFNKIQMK